MKKEEDLKEEKNKIAQTLKQIANKKQNAPSETKKNYETLDDAAKDIQNMYEVCMISVELCKSLIEQMNIDDYRVAFDKNTPGIEVTMGSSNCCVFYSAEHNTAMVKINTSDHSQLFFAVPMDDDCIDRLQNVLEVMKLAKHDTSYGYTTGGSNPDSWPGSW